MKLGIISDTHNRLENIICALDFFLDQEINIIFHCGDWVNKQAFEFAANEAHKRGQELYGVLGNNDIIHSEKIYKANSKFYQKVNLPKGNQDFLVYKYKKRNFAVYHGHNKQRLNEIISSDNFEAIFVGHTHVPKEEYILNTKILNPGSLSFSIPFKKREEEIYTVGVYDLGRRKFKVYQI